MTRKLSNRAIAKIAFATARGGTEQELAEALAGIATADQIIEIRRQFPVADIADGEPFKFCFQLDNARRAALVAKANALGIPPFELIRRILICVLAENLYETVNDGRF